MSPPQQPSGFTSSEFEPGEFERVIQSDPFDEVSGIILLQRQAIAAAFRGVDDIQHPGSTVIETVASILNQHTAVIWRFPGAIGRTVSSHPFHDDSDLVDMSDDNEREDDDDEYLDCVADEPDHLTDERAVAVQLWHAWRQRVDVAARLRDVATAGEAVAIIAATTCPSVCHRRASGGPFGIVEFTRDVGLPPYGPGCTCNVVSAPVVDALAALRRRKPRKAVHGPVQETNETPGWQKCKYDNTKPGWVQVDGPGKLHIDPKSGCANVKSSLTEHRGSYACDPEGIRITKAAQVEQISVETLARWSAPASVTPPPAPLLARQPSLEQPQLRPRGTTPNPAFVPPAMSEGDPRPSAAEEPHPESPRADASNAFLRVAIVCAVLTSLALLAMYR